MSKGRTEHRRVVFRNSLGAEWGEVGSDVRALGPRSASAALVPFHDFVP